MSRTLQFSKPLKFLSTQEKMSNKPIDSHQANEEKKRKRSDVATTKNKKDDQKKFINSISRIFLHTETELFAKKVKEDENKDKLLEAIKEFLTKIKSPDMVRETITEIGKIFTKEKWENHFYMNVIRKLREDPSDASKRVLKLIISEQSNRFESLKGLFQFVNNIMILKEQENFQVSASIFLEMLKVNYSHVNWLLIGINALINCYNYEMNVDALKTLENILNDYIDIWTFYISTPSEKRRFQQYKSMMPKKSLDEIRTTIMNVVYPGQEKKEVILIEESKFKIRKKKLRKTTIKIRNSLAFEVHKVKVGLHLTKHLMRNFVTNRSSKERNHILAKVNSCKYEFYVKFESVKMVDIMKKAGLREVICDQIVQNGSKKQEPIRVKVDYKNNPELVEENGNFWIMKTIDLPFRFTSCNCTVEIPEIGYTQEVVELFDLTTKMEYQIDELPNFRFYERTGMKKRIKPLKENVFDTDFGYLDGNYYAYQVTPSLPSSSTNNKLPIRVILEGRPMSKLIVETKIKPMKNIEK
ncbi:predicted protein [Naegleria gruberi]|uniref:Predicted protein n=1 Tax=Naegleria gruberi TaxID=5762 RepID=D2V489_NAEGR|nr:uncharacterized protein NAEGRDRAFT_46568 [Naegleria gruberi]EFC48339.1 predicted protein [Naegleria gruberi]|eukprot:XP_002681083.1 predicted protein [Naegleria gruberi strain NEG-M]